MNEKLTIHIGSAEKRSDLPEYTQEKCPYCGGDTEDGFGLAGGGFGVYTFCPTCKVITSKTICEDL